ncbi:hypothetical protein ACOI1H_02815 [Loktanella sp. DJP18]|uniref:hypothetical protein n=1 Tax=Loktanella sp. DJP18 TaxID=3409788 RepID=UPI003BB52135
MRDRFVHPLRPTPGERRLLAAGLGVAVCGGLMSFVIVTQMGQNKTMLRSMTDADLWFVTAGMLGGIGGLYMGRNWLGHGGPAGAVKAVAGMLVVSFAGALIAGSLALPLYGTMFGPLMLGLTLAGNPALALLWLTVMTGSHLLFRTWRREKKSLFAPLAAQAEPRGRASPLRWVQKT